MFHRTLLNFPRANKSIFHKHRWKVFQYKGSEIIGQNQRETVLCIFHVNISYLHYEEFILLEKFSDNKRSWYFIHLSSHKLLDIAALPGFLGFPSDWKRDLLLQLPLKRHDSKPKYMWIVSYVTVNRKEGENIKKK